MGQQVFKVYLDVDESTEPNTNAISSISGKEDISFMLSSKAYDTKIELNRLNNDYQTLNSESESIKQIRNNLALLVKLVQWEGVQTEIDDMLMNNVLSFITGQSKKVNEELDDRLAYKKQLQKAFMNKVKDDHDAHTPICVHSIDDTSSEDQKVSSSESEHTPEQIAKRESKQLSYYAVQSLVSVLLVLIKSVEKNDPAIIHQILTLTSQLCEQMPIKAVSSMDNLLFKSLKPLINYIHELSVTNNPIIVKQTITILLAFSIGKGALKDILYLLSKLTFNTSEIYNFQGLFIQLNNNIRDSINKWEKQNKSSVSDLETNDTRQQNDLTEPASIDYLKSIGAYPNSKLLSLSEELFTGEFISSIVLSHIDIEREINASNKQPKLTSISCELHPNTFNYLFNIIEQLTKTSSQLNNITVHNVNVCLKLFTTHLKILSDVKFDNNTDLSTFINQDEFKKWFDLFLNLSCNENFEQTKICKEASKALMRMIEIQTSSFPERLSIIHQHINENKYPILVKQFLIELNRNEILVNWIDVLLQSENKTPLVLQITYSFLDLYFNRHDEQKLLLQQILLSFQQLLLSRLLYQSENKNSNNQCQLSSLIIQYLTYTFKNGLQKVSSKDPLFDSIFIGLGLMTKTNEIFLYESMQPILIVILPILVDYYLQNVNHEYKEFICHLIGKISHVLIIGSPQDSLEIKYVNQLKSPAFSGGCITEQTHHLLSSSLATYSQYQLVNNKQDDKAFLLSVFNNVDEGAQLISKLKSCFKGKERLLQKSIEQHANDACAAVFAVYVKFYRRIKLAKNEILKPSSVHPHDLLMQTYEYAHHVVTLFSTVKAQGGDCDELLNQIKMKANFLLLSIEENGSVPVFKEDTPPIVIDTLSKRTFEYKRQRSKWSQAKHIITLLRNIFQACIRFKKMMLKKRNLIEQKYNFESLLRQGIDNFLYEDFYKTPASINPEEQKLKLDELEKCLHRQQERALLRLITYRFVQKFLQNVLNLNDNNLSQKILSIYLPYLRKADLDWSYFEHISGANYQVKDEISNNYYSIIKLVLSSCLTSKNLIESIFYLLNISFESIGLCQIYQHQFVETLFKSFVCYTQKSKSNNLSLDLKLIASTWFRLFIVKLCENIQIEKQKDALNEILQKQQKFIFNTLILNELKDESSIESGKKTKNSLQDIPIRWFLEICNSSVNLHEPDIELYKNQFLIILLECFHHYKHALSVCSHVNYLTELLNIYHHSQSILTRLLSIKILRYLIPNISSSIDGISGNLIENFLNNVLNSLGENSISQEIIAELIYMYRTIMSMNSPWQRVAKDLVLDSIKLHLNLNSIERNDKQEMNKLLAALCILGEYIEPYRLGSIVRIQNDKNSYDEYLLALIIEIEQNLNDTKTPYLVQYLHTDKTEQVSIDKLKIEADVLPPTLSNIEDAILDILGYFILIDTCKTPSLMLLQLKRRSISVLYYMLNDKKLAHIFMAKPYASAIAKLCLSNENSAKFDLCNKENLEKYFLTLDLYERLRLVYETDSQAKIQNSVLADDLSNFIWNVDEFDPDPSVMNMLSTPMLHDSEWRPYVFISEIEFFKQGRMGTDEISIVSLPHDVSSSDAIQECGNKHRFRGRIAPDNNNTRMNFPTYIIENLQVNAGKWYYCVRLPVGGVIQIGWATNGMAPNTIRGVGDDKYSWSYDGSRAALFYEEEFSPIFNNVRWKPNDVCGCGIDIDGKDINIKYWLNGKLLGTAFAHNAFIEDSYKQCNLLPNGPSTTYFPSVTIQIIDGAQRYCELILSPEDMQDCPMPKGYKPLISPKPIHTQFHLVDYPFSAYLVGENPEDYFYTTRLNKSNVFLRDFINEQHLETTFNIDNHHIVLPDKSTGFPLRINNDLRASLTISFDFQILSSEEKLELILFKFDSTEIKFKSTNEKIHCAIVFLTKKCHIKVYINKTCRTYTNGFDLEAIKQLNLNLLPGIEARIKNLAVWKYALSEGNIRNLFTYNLSFIAIEHQQLKEYRKRVNKISFAKDQKCFMDEYILPFDEPFQEDIWNQKKIQADNNESHYFKTDDNAECSVVELYGNKTYLVLEKPNESWDEYTLILKISVPKWPNNQEKLTLIILNSSSRIYITHEGQVCLEINQTKTESKSKVMLQEYFDLSISARDKKIEIYINDSLEIAFTSDDNRLPIKSNRIDLFKETNLRKNTTAEHQLRISLKSITYLNKSISADHLNSPTLTEPSFLMIGSNLMLMGYKKSWIESIIEKYKTTHIPTIHKILLEQKEQLFKNDIAHEQEHCFKVLSKSNPSINEKTLKDLIYSSKLETNEQIINIAQTIFPKWIQPQSSSNSDIDKQFELNEDEQWFSKAVKDLDMSDDIKQWIIDKSSNISVNYDIYQLIDLKEIDRKQKIKTETSKFIKYPDKTISSKEFLTSRIHCEQGLTTIYARYTILNMIQIYLQNSLVSFPLEKLGDYPFIIILFKLLEHVQIDKDEKINRIDLLINLILKTELKTLFESNDSIDHDTLQSKAPLTYHLQKHIFTEAIQLLLKPSLFSEDFNEILVINERQPDFNLILKILGFFIELIKDRSIMKENQADVLISLLFTEQFVNLMFDLLLLIPTHQAKISIICQFTSLLETSKNFMLNERIQKFVFNLLIQLSSDEELDKNGSRKYLQTALADLIFVILRKQKREPAEDDETDQPTMPEHIGNLFKAIQIILAWTDPQKGRLLPEFFLEKSPDILGDNFKLNQDDFKTSNSYFNITVDQDLINFMNNDTSLQTSFSNFIEKLPKGSQPNSAFYNKYTSLSNIPANIISIRAQFLYLLNILVEESVPLVDFSLPVGRSFLTDQMRKIKPYLLSSFKLKLFSQTLKQTEIPYDGNWTTVQLDIIKADTDSDNSEDTIFYQAFKQLHPTAHRTFRRSDEQLWRAQYVGMHSTDQGGPYRDSITRMCSDICSTRLSLFILCPNARTNTGLNRDCWIPNVFSPYKPIENIYKKQYRFIGQLFGMAIRKKHYLNLKFPPLLWKQLLKESITIQDIEAIDSQSFTIINETEKYLEQIKSVEGENDIGSLFSSIMSELRFDVISSSGETFDLIPDGKDIPIAIDNFKYYCSCYQQYRLNEFSRQIDFIREGLFSVIPCYYINLFTASELEEAICGKGRIDIEILKRNTHYGGHYNSESSVIEQFWTVLSEMFNDEQKKLFLIFVWGRSTLPVRDADFELKFTINPLDIYDSDIDKILPQSHTCFFALDLPAYSTAEVMYERLNYAITSCASIDGDGHLNFDPRAHNDDMDSNSDEE